MAISTGIVLAFCAMFALGIHDFLGKIVLKKLKPFQLLFLEYLFGVILLIPFLFFTEINFELNSIYLIIIMGLLHVAAYYGLFGAIKIGKVSLVSAIAASYTLPTLLLAMFFLNEKLQLYQWLGVFLAVIGIFLVSLEKSEKIKISKGVLLALIPLGTFALVFFLYQPITAIFGFAFGVFLFKTVVVLTLAPKHLSSFKVLNKKLFLVVLIMALLETIMQISYAVSTLMEKISLTVPIINAFPAVVFILGYVFLKERLQISQYVGLLLLIPALIFLSI